MSYSSNPLLPKARADAVRLVVERGLPLSVAARRSGVHRTTLWRWYKLWQARGYTGFIQNIPTKSSRPQTFGRAVSDHVIARIRYYRERYQRCAAVTHAYCVREGLTVSVSTVRRVLRRLGLTARRKWKHYRPSIPRPAASAPGALIQTDTVHLYDPRTKGRTYLYTMVDVYSRWAYTEHHDFLSQELAADVIRRGAAYAGFRFAMVQADNGPEFGARFEQLLAARGTMLRHSRVRRPNDNAHIERFNRTIQEECHLPVAWSTEEKNSKVLTYLAYYNEERLHLGLQCRTPEEVLRRW